MQAIIFKWLLPLQKEKQTFVSDPAEHKHITYRPIIPSCNKVLARGEVSNDGHLPQEALLLEDKTLTPPPLHSKYDNPASHKIIACFPIIPSCGKVLVVGRLCNADHHVQVSLLLEKKTKQTQKHDLPSHHPLMMQATVFKWLCCLRKKKHISVSDPA